MKKFFVILTLILILPLSTVQALTEDNINNLLNQTDTLINDQEVSENLDKRYPVGSIYISTTSTNPGSIFGGTWESFGGGRKLVATGSNGTTDYTSANQTGGNKTVTLSSSNLPSHNHSATPSGTVTSSFTGTSVTTSSNGAHTHTAPFGRASEEASGYGLVYDINYGYYRDRPMISGPTVSINDAGAHTHSLTASGTVTSTFSGKTVTTSSNGSGSSIDIMNPYITVYMWRRTA